MVVSRKKGYDIMNYISGGDYMNKKATVKWIGNIVFILLFALVTLFGLGPVLMADGTFQERMLTLLIVLVIYALLILGFRYWIRRNK